MAIPRQQLLRQRRSRRHKLGKLRKLYAAARTQDDRSRILNKMTRVSPGLTPQTFLSPAGRS
jgi:hypothetical protein